MDKAHDPALMWQRYIRHSGGSTAALDILRGLRDLELDADAYGKARELVLTVYRRESKATDKNFDEYMNASR